MLLGAVEPSRRTLGHRKSDLDGGSGSLATRSLSWSPYGEPLPPSHTPFMHTALSQTWKRWN